MRTGWTTLMLLAAIAALGGCTSVLLDPATDLPATAPADLPTTVPTTEPASALTGAATASVDSAAFNELAAVLRHTIDDQGRVDPTALAVYRPRLDRQLARLAAPWPAEARTPGSDERLAWLYNARAALSLRLAGDLLKPARGPQGRFALPATAEPARLLSRPFTLDGEPSSLAKIDEELAADADFRVLVVAPGVTDAEGQLPRRPFPAAGLRASLPERFNEYMRDEARVVVDVDRHRLLIPPALARFAPGLIADYTRRFGTRQVTLASALMPYLDAPARRRLQDAVSFPAVERRGRANLLAQPESAHGRWLGR